jgi:hypothetical protein
MPRNAAEKRQFARQIRPHIVLVFHDVSTVSQHVRGEPM